jgi:uncharacterized protein (DUF2384 family)
MPEGLKGYNGAVNGVKIRHGVAIVSKTTPTLPRRGGATPTRSSSETHQQAQEVDIEPIVRRVIEVIGDRDDAMRWLGTPVRALDYATPISRLHDPESREQVLSVLTQLEHGVL